MSIPSGLSGGAGQTNRPLTQQLLPAIFGNVINASGIGTTYDVAHRYTFTNNSGLTSPVVWMYISTASTGTLFISFDGTHDNIAIPAGTTLTFDVLNNRRGIPQSSFWLRATTAGGTATISYMQ